MRQLGERILETSVLDRDAEMLGEGEEQSAVGRRESRRLVDAVGDEHHPCQPIFVEEGSGHARPDLRAVDEEPGYVPQQQRGLGFQGSCQGVGAGIRLDRLEAVDETVGRAQRVEEVAMLTQHDDLDVRHTEHRLRLLGGGGERVLDLGRLVEQRARLVELLQSLPFDPVGDRSAVCGQQHRRWHHGHPPQGR